MRQNLSKLLQVRVTPSTVLNVKNTAKELNVRPADIMRMALAVGLKSLAHQTTNKANGEKMHNEAI